MLKNSLYCLRYIVYGVLQKLNNFWSRLKNLGSGYDTLWRLIKTYLIPQKRYWVLGIGSMILTAGSTAILAQYLKPIFDDIFVGHRQDLLIWIGIGVFSIFFVKGAAEYIGERCMAAMGYILSTQLQNDVFAHMIHFDLDFFRNYHEARCANVFSQDIGIVRETLLQSLSTLSRDVFMVLSLVIVLLREDVLLFLSALFIVPIMAGLLRICGQRAKHIFLQIQNKSAVLQQFFQQIFHQIIMVKAYGTEEYEKKCLKEFTENILKEYKKAAKIQAIIHPFMEILGGAIIASIVIYGGYRVIQGIQTPGSFLTFITALFFLYRPIKNILQVHTRLQACIVSGERILNLLDRPISLKKESVLIGNSEIFSKDIVFEGVTFGYTPEQRILRDVYCSFKANKQYAIVGPSGSGKTTMFYLLLQLYFPHKGRILFSGKDALMYSPRWIRDNIGFVSQDITLFDTTIQDNIVYGSSDASIESIRYAAELAQVSSFAELLPQGYNTPVGPHGLRLSGGQRQRLALARAILKKSPILLLDEATSALDVGIEESIRQGLQNLNYPCTQIYIAHRLSSIQNVDKILVMKQGCIQEEGTHLELLSKKGDYALLWEKSKINDNENQMHGVYL
ncbi:lipid A export ATP-binding/permease protein MsbA [Holospora undulata HU1]|uniref:Lipid A export ATP-binding/permease protein MsbA n=1 Tax=Holospora undulata HU1 TaxID=1321371 RepID=A0A061JHN8_9PROT|nr:lipid A export ATP-binding/permease protein MsbA [Holospora undulata HU1]